MTSADPFADRRLVREIRRAADVSVPHSTWPATIPAVAAVLDSGLQLGDGVTFLVGENGSGKSTLIEAAAAAYGLGPEGGTVHSAHTTRQTESPLGDWISLAKKPGAPKWGFFLRAETMHGYYTFQDSLVGGHDFHSMSHGESFLAVAETYLTRPGFYCLDEPEAALSFSSTLAMIGVLAEVVANGSQVLCATHSPVLASLPGATIYEFGDHGIRRTAWEDLNLVTHWKSYLDGPGRYLRHVLS
ncbi:AAA family ATPase [Mycetocola zhadangensis]|uniref:ATP-binding cassette domain-containing protein n=1 Tax=Mycetocola zhadangensis TaxID=1164595 RepID=A0A3L7J647_9MICO|nr:AAA family ATPase [Mycetocola zhadangensis]RLQ85939.1 ATP-binding cassette domain-containing protein [Mycetocola zhadangensis]GGE87096.1 ABC transporter, ATP-binding protein [Mycetocola zhadangensis]